MRSGRHRIVRTRGAILVILCGIGIVIASGCTGQTKRLDPDALSEQEVGTGLTSQDFRSVCERMARSLVRIPQIQQASTPPKIVLYPVENHTNDYIEADEFTHKIRTLLIKHSEGKALFLDRNLVSAIKQEQREKRRGKVTSAGEKDRFGADFFLTGRIAAIDRVAGAGATGYYRLSFRLTDAATSAIAWEDEYEIKKASTVGGVYR
ncbi:MAG TPA: penicillin-binding protein activator LpoB [Phycisphaerae bacterium]|nr:penicillin-binding protein activator LpoB [Phycisphaerae bacterium]